MDNNIRVYINKTHTEAVIPIYRHEGDSGCDLCSIEDVSIKPGDICVVDTGLRIAMPIGVEAQIRPRSGLASKKGLTVVNTPGTIDSGYRGNIKVALINLGKKDVEVKKGDRMAQIIFMPVYKAYFIETIDLEDTTRGSGGFGSTNI